jgi:hypothetical protein
MEKLRLTISMSMVMVGLMLLGADTTETTNQAAEVAWSALAWVLLIVGFTRAKDIIDKYQNNL